MFVVIKIILIITFIVILYQDLKERQADWFLFPIVGFCSGVLMYSQMVSEVFIATVLFNMSLVTVMLLLMSLVTILIMKRRPREVIGLGDVLFFYVLTFCFAMVSFYVLFIFSFIFALALQLIFKKNFKDKTVPLAGFIGVFFGLVYISYWTGIIDSIYHI